MMVTLEQSCGIEVAQAAPRRWKSTRPGMRKCVNSSACIAGEMHDEAEAFRSHLLQYSFHTLLLTLVLACLCRLAVALLLDVFESQSRWQYSFRHCPLLLVFAANLKRGAGALAQAAPLRLLLNLNLD